MNRELVIYLSPHGLKRRSIMQDIADAGLSLIGLDGSGWDPETERCEIDDFLNEVHSFGLNIYSMHACCHILASADCDTPPELLNEQLKEIKRFSMFGGKTAVYHACFMENVEFLSIDSEIEKVGWDSFVERNAKTITILAREAGKSGISIVLENVHYNTHTESFAGFLDIINAVDEPNVGFLIDSGHANIAEKKVADEIRFAGDLLMDTHFHDNVGPVTNTQSDDQHIPPGLGTIDWEDTVRALDEINYDRPIVFEVRLEPGESLPKGHCCEKLSHRELIDITINNWRKFESVKERTIT